MTAERSGSANRGGESPPPPRRTATCAPTIRRSQLPTSVRASRVLITRHLLYRYPGVLLDRRLWEAVTGRCHPLHGGASTPSEVGVPAGW